MTKEIQEVIEKNLPAQVGETLTKLINQGKSDAEKVVRLEEFIESQKKIIKEINESLDGYRQKDACYAKLTQWEHELKEKERDRKVFEAELKAAEAEKRATEAVSLVGLVFKSPVYRKYTSESFMTSTNYKNNGDSEVYTTGKDKSETTQIE